MKTLSDIGEFSMIEKIARQSRAGKGVVKGIGDDAAVLDCGGEDYLLYTTDMLVEGVHFLRTVMTPQEIGRKALACSISDIAAMGGTPTYAVVSTAMPSNTLESFFEKIGQGFRDLADQFHVKLVGGDMTCGPRLVINVALMGRVKRNEVIYRCGARPKDVIFVTGALGNSFMNRKHIQFCPRVEEAHYLLKHARPTSMIDISDGLAGDLGHILKESHVGAVIDASKIPLAKGARLKGALHDGEDFELLFTVGPKDAETLRKVRKFPFYEIGVIQTGSKCFIKEENGRKRILKLEGFTHFRDSDR